MATKAGVWIDHRQATVVLATDAGNTIKKIASGLKSADHSRMKHKYTKNDFVAEDSLQRKFLAQLKNFYDEVIDSVRDAEAFLIVGPGEAKGQFMKRLKSNKLRGRIAELETTDKMTDSELAAKVYEHFFKKPATKQAAAKKGTKTKAGQSSKRMGK